MPMGQISAMILKIKDSVNGAEKEKSMVLMIEKHGI